MPTPTTSSVPSRRAPLRKRIVHALGVVLSDFGICVALLLITPMPRCLVRAVARGMGWLAAKIPNNYRKMALANMRIAFPEKSEKEIRALALANFRHVALLTFDYFWFGIRTRQRLLAHCVCNDPALERWLSSEKAGIFVTMHLGNWEIGGHYAAVRGRPLNSVFKPFGSQLTQKFLARFRGEQGQVVIPRSGAMLGMLHCLHKNKLVAMLLDQHTEPTDGGVYFPFFGLPAAISSAAGVLAHRLHVPVLVATITHDDADDTYHMRTVREFTVEEVTNLSAHEINTGVVEAIQQAIRLYPEQWLWSYRRWKRYPIREWKSRYPYYSKFGSLEHLSEKDRAAALSGLSEEWKARIETQKTED